MWPVVKTESDGLSSVGGSGDCFEVKIGTHIIATVNKQRKIYDNEKYKKIDRNMVEEMVADHSYQQTDKDNIDGIKIQHAESR